MQRHIIHKQIITLNLQQPEESQMLQDMVSRLFSNDIITGMEKIMDELSSDGEIIRLDKIELDIGSIPLENFELGFTTQFLQSFAKKMSDCKTDFYANAKTQTIPQNRSQSVMDTLIYFLLHGRLPWYASRNSFAQWEKEILSAFTEKEWHSLIGWLKQNTGTQKPVVKRLAEQFSTIFRIRLLQLAMPDFESEWQKLTDDFIFLKNSIPVIGTGITNARLWESMLNSVLLNTVNILNEEPKEQNVNSFSYRFALAVLHDVFGEQIISPIDLKKMKTPSWQKKMPSFMVNALYAVLKERKADRTSINKSDSELQKKQTNNNNTAPNSLDSSNENNADKKNGNKEIKVPFKNEHSLLLPDESVWVSNCGIVLLHPFLQSYFTELGLYVKKEFINEDAHKRAVLLLHYLCTGETSVAEFDLVLQKILCGLIVEETIPALIELTEKEQSESESLLKAVCGHWSPLKNTSVDGLRASFLQRKGRLLYKDYKWQLNIEQKAMDILLDKLPWGYSIVRLPWMDGILNVDWR